MGAAPNIVLVVVDSLRYDRCGFAGHNPRLMPALMALAGSGTVFHSHFSTGSPTQVAMPAVFTSSYPLDYGGYNHGIRNRPVTLAEQLKSGGYQTVGIHTTSHTSSWFGYGRGFDVYDEMVDLQFWFGGMYNRWLHEPVQQWRAGTLSDAGITEVIERDYSEALRGAIAIIDHMDEIGVPEGWRRRAGVRAAAMAELDIVARDPVAVAEKTAALKRHYDLGLGHPRVTADLVRTVERYERFEKAMGRRMRLVIRRRCRANATVVNRYLARELARVRRHSPMFLYLHYFDIHESKFLVPQMSFERLARLPTDVVRTLRPGPRNAAGGRLYDASCSYVDQELAVMVRLLAGAGFDARNTVFVVTADHGVEAGPNRRVARDLSQQFYNEYLHVPLLLAGSGIGRDDVRETVTHLDVAPTVLDIAGIRVPGEFRGRSLVGAGARRPVRVLAENTGPGRCDLEVKPIYLSLQEGGIKVMYRAADREPEEQAVFDLSLDPHEENDLAATRAHAPARQALLAAARARVAEARPKVGRAALAPAG